MWIKSLELKNFQKHSSLKLDFTEGVNVLYGHSDAGKSCIRRAIEWVCQNTKIDGIRKANTKLTSVRLTLHNDIGIERQRSASINRYVIYKDGEEKQFDAIGKSIPQEIKDILKLEPINIDGEDIYLNSSPQISLPFLFDRSPSFRMKLFNKLTGNDVLDKLFVQFNKDILSINREHKRESGHLEEQSQKLADQLIKKEKMEAVHNRVTKTMENLRQLNEKYCKLLELVELTSVNAVNIVRVEKNLKDIKIPDISDIKGLMEKVKRLEQLIASENDAEKTQIALDKVKTQLKEFRVPTLKYDEMKDKIQRVEKLSAIAETLDNNGEICYTLKEKIEIVQKRTKDCMDSYKELLKSVQICPTCGQQVTDNCLKEMTL